MAGWKGLPTVTRFVVLGVVLMVVFVACVGVIAGVVDDTTTTTSTTPATSTTTVAVSTSIPADAACEVYGLALSMYAVTVGEQIGVIGEAATAAGYGEITMDEAADRMMVAASDLRSILADIDRLGNPPEELDGSIRLFGEGVETIAQSAEDAASGARLGDSAAIDAATADMLNGAALISAATARMGEC